RRGCPPDRPPLHPRRSSDLVLVVDMDPQGNASTALGVPHQSGTKGIYDVLIDGLALEDVVQTSPSVPGLLCAPATIDLAGAEIRSEAPTSELQPRENLVCRL